MSRKTTAVTGGQTGTKEQYNYLRDEAEASSRLLARAQASPNLTLYVSEGAVYFGLTRVDYAGGNTASFADPASTNRIDCLSLSPAGALVITQGVEGASPAEPSCPTANIPICFVYNKHGQTSIKETSDGTNGYIYKDTRNIMNLVKEARSYLTEVSNANPAINTDLYDRYELTAQAVAVSSFSTNLSGSPKVGDRLRIKITKASSVGAFVSSNDYYNGTNISTHTITKPTGTQDGDIMICGIRSMVGYPNSVPAGWNLLAQGTDTHYFSLYYKIASSEPASWNWGFASTTNYPQIETGVFRGGFDPSNPIDAISFGSYTTGDNIIRGVSMNVSNANSLLVMIGLVYGGGSYTPLTKPTVPTSGWTKHAENGGGGVFGLFSMTWAGSGATGNMDILASQATGGAKKGMVVSLNPAPVNITLGASFSAQDYTLPTKIINPTTLDFIFNGSTWATYSILDKVSSVLGLFDMASANGAKYYAHGLGKVPSRIRIKATYIAGTTNSSESFGVFDNLNQNKCIYLWKKEGTSTAVADVAGNSNTQAIILSSDATSSNQQVGVITVDATNVIITWTKTGSPTGTAYLLLEAE